MQQIAGALFPDMFPSLSLSYQEGEGQPQVFRAILVKDEQVEDLTFDESTAPDSSDLLHK